MRLEEAPRLDLPALSALLGFGAHPICEEWLRPLVVGGCYEQQAAQAAPRQLQEGGKIAVIPMNGVITPKPSLFELFGMATSIVTIERALSAAVSAPGVEVVVLDIDSPGGSIAGVPELAQAIRAARDVKPIIAVANYLTASAAYWLAANATRVEAPGSAMVGSVGVYSLHVDYSAMLEKDGIKPTFISAGAHKVEGNPYQPLSDAARDNLQSTVDEAYAAFVGDVAAGRGVAVADVERQYGQGRLLTSREAQAAGVVDGNMTLGAVLASFGAGERRPERPRRRGLSVAMATRRLRVATL